MDKIVDLFKKLYRYRLKIDRKGKTILNWSSLFSVACLILAPHMTVAGTVLSLILGYHINLETEGEDTELEERMRSAAETVKKTAASAAKTIRSEIEKARGEDENKTVKEAQSAPEKQEAPQATPVMNTVPQAAPAKEAQAAVNQDVLQDLEQHANEFQANPAVFRSAYSASASSVPTLQVHEEAQQDPGAPAPRHMQ